MKELLDLPLNSMALMALDAYVWGSARLKYERALGIASIDLPLNSIALMALDAYVWGSARLKYERALGIASTGHMIPEEKRNRNNTKIDTYC